MALLERAGGVCAEVDALATKSLVTRAGDVEPGPHDACTSSQTSDVTQQTSDGTKQTSHVARHVSRHIVHAFSALVRCLVVK